MPVEKPVALSQIFAKDAAKQRQWAAFVRDLDIDVPSLDVLVANLSEFLLPHARHAKSRFVGTPKGGGS